MVAESGTTTESFAPVPVSRRELVQELELGGLRFTESWHRASSTIEWHAHQRATVTILVDGSFEELYARSPAVDCLAPAVHIRPPGEPHLDRLGSGGAHNLVLEVNARRLDDIRRHSAIFDEIRSLTQPNVLALARRIQEELTLRDDASVLALEGLSLELLGCASRSAGYRGRQAPPWLRRARELLHDRFRDQGLRMDAIARVVEIHPVQLARAFRRHYGASPGEYLRQLRVGWAADQIRDTERPLAEIALDAGFADQSHLSRVFKARLGWTPAAWRRQQSRI